MQYIRELMRFIKDSRPNSQDGYVAVPRVETSEINPAPEDFGVIYLDWKG